MKHLLLTTITAVVLVGCGESQQSSAQAETKPVEPVTEVAQPEPPIAKTPSISIHKAAWDGNIEAVKQHIAAGADVSVKKKNSPAVLFEASGTPLHYASTKEIVELLIAKGADVNAKSSDGSTPLHDAAYYGRTIIAELLIAKGADVNAKDEVGLTPLHRANLTKEIAELLIAEGADVNAKEKYGETPLNWAILLGQTETADLLRKHGGKTGEELKAAGK